MKLKKHLTYTRRIALGFFALLLFGALFLMLPCMNKNGQWTPFIDALFTATSATCVTGLVVHDTYTYWTIGGQLLILFLIQIGGVGFMTILTLFSILSKRQIPLHERRLLMQSAGAINVGGIVKLVKEILKITLFIELAGAIILAFRFCVQPDIGIQKGIYFAIFHSVSAFCNAGFDLMGIRTPGSSLSSFRTDPVFMLTIICLILSGGLGFLVWDDLRRNKFKFKRYSLHTKLVVIISAVLVVGGAVLFGIFESHHTQAGMSIPMRVVSSLFDAVTPRTAGFDAYDMTKYSESSSLLTIILMFIGGNPGSTAGGVKTTTILILMLSISATCNHQANIGIYKRRLEDSAVKQASAIISIYMILIFASSMLIGAIEPYSLKHILFETTSAVGTVGLSLGMTQTLHLVSKLIITFLMFTGRIGGLTLALVFADKQEYIPIEHPVEKILIG